MHKSHKRLQINKQTVRHLTDLERVNGGRICSTISIAPGPSIGCPMPTGICPAPSSPEACGPGSGAC